MSLEQRGGGSSFVKRKVGGVPVVYLAGGFVAVLLVIAWRMKNSAAAATDPTATDPTAATGSAGTGAVDGNGDPSAVYPTMPTGTVVVAPSTPVDTNVPDQTNTDWLKKAVTYLVNTKGHSPGDAQQAITLYLDGENLSYAQGQMRDEAVKQLGLPPDPGSVGSTGAKPVTTVPTPAAPKPSPPPVQRQGVPPIWHTVRGVGDNSIGDLIKLYYGNGQDMKYMDLFEIHNPSLPPNGTLRVGTKVYIPKYVAPKYFKATTSVRSATAIAARNGISVKTLTLLNDGVGSPKLTFPAPVGAQVRVQ
jgi:hypothetical protein